MKRAAEHACRAILQGPRLIKKINGAMASKRTSAISNAHSFNDTNAPPALVEIPDGLSNLIDLLHDAIRRLADQVHDGNGFGQRGEHDGHAWPQK